MPRESISPEVDDEIKKTRLNKSSDIYHQREDLKAGEKWSKMNRKQKFEFYKEHYLIASIICAAFLICAILIILWYTIPGKADDFHAALFYTTFKDNDAQEAMKEDFAEYLGITGRDTLIVFDKYSDFINEDTWFEFYFNRNRFDILITYRFPVYTYNANDILADLSAVLPAELYSELLNNNMIYYIEAKDDSGEYPGGILIPTDIFYDYSTGENEPIKNPIFGIFTNTTRMDRAIKFIEYLLERV